MIGSAVEEKLAFFPSQGLDLSGILSVPAEPNGLSILIAWGGGAYPSSGRNQIRARFAAAVAEHGYHAFRFDYRGIGESDGDYVKPDLKSPYTADIVAASNWLVSQGLTRLVIVGNCFGGWSSLIAAPMISGLEGLVVLNAPVGRDHSEVAAVKASWRWWLTRLKRFRPGKLFDADLRALYRRMVGAKVASTFAIRQAETSRYSRAVRYVLANEIPLLLVYADDAFRRDFEAELDRGLRAEIESAKPPTRFVTVDQRLEGFASLPAQEVLFREVVPWLHELPRGLDGQGRR